MLLHVRTYGGNGSKLTNAPVHCRCVNKNTFHSSGIVQRYQNQNGFRSHECMWIPSERLKPVFHQFFIWHLMGEEDSYPGDEHSHQSGNHVSDETTDENTA